MDAQISSTHIKICHACDPGVQKLKRSCLWQVTLVSSSSMRDTISKNQENWGRHPLLSSSLLILTHMCTCALTNTHRPPTFLHTQTHLKATHVSLLLPILVDIKKAMYKKIMNAVTCVSLGGKPCMFINYGIEYQPTGIQHCADGKRNLI